MKRLTDDSMRNLKANIVFYQICGWDEDTRILEVHHINSDRSNNDLSNLMILCPICHTKITLGYYKIHNDTLVLI